jgi:Fe-S oxidoreductase
VDDNLIGDRRAAKELLPALAEWRKDKVGIIFSTQVSINLADDEELLHRMVEAGFTTVFIGIETPCEESLSEAHKAQNIRRDLLESVRRIQRAGMHVEGGFIVGFDSDPPSIFRRQMEFIQQSGIAAAMVGLLQATYGTRLYERLKREGRLTGDPSGNNVVDFTNIIPKMGLEVLRDGYRALLKHIYSPAAYYERVRTFLKEYRPPRIRVHLDWEAVLAFFRSVYHLGIRGAERVHYWRLLLWTLFRRPRSFPMAVTLAIYGFHFRRVCEEQVLRMNRSLPQASF